jgi:hypothetical protein
MLILAAELRLTKLAPKRSEYTDASVPSFSEVVLQLSLRPLLFYLFKLHKLHPLDDSCPV